MSDLYDGFDDVDDTIVSNNVGDYNAMNEDTVPSSSFNMSETARPMTSNKPAGYSSLRRGKKNKISTLNDNTTQPKETDNNITNEHDKLSLEADKMERNVNKLLRESIFYSASGTPSDLETALDLAQKCRKKENEVISFREKHNLEDNINLDLTFSVLFNLGYIYQLKKMYIEALNIYNTIISSCSNSNKIEIISRVRVNIGNIYYIQQKYDLAIKHYRMSLDQIGDISYKLKILIMRNIGNSFLKLGQFVDAIQSFETIVELNMNMNISNHNDIQTIFNLLVSYYILGEKEKMKKGFIHLLNYSLLIPIDRSQTNDNNNDEYSIYINKKWLKLSFYIKQSVQLIGKAIASHGDTYDGYQWLINNLHQIKTKGNNSNNKYIESFFDKIINEIVIIQGIEYLKDNKFELAVSIFNNDKHTANMYNNLSFINFLKCEYELSSKYAISAIEYDRYNSMSLVNRANCLYIYGEYELSKEMYLEAIGVESDCSEAIYNLGLICKKIGNYQDALQAFKKLNKIYKNNPQILYQICDLYQLLNEYEIAIKYFKILHSLIPNDSDILIKLANLYKIYLKDETLIYHNYLDSYKLNKCNINIISWIGIFYINNNLYENAINIFKNANIITNSKEIKWKLMIASCFRRMRNFEKAIKIYKKIYNDTDDDQHHTFDIKIKCLQYLCTIMKQINHPQLDKYQNELDEMQMEQSQHEMQRDHPQSMNIEPQIQNQQQHEQHEQHQHHVNVEDDNNENEADDDWADVDIDDELLPS